jgi:hypothetical protein
MARPVVAVDVDEVYLTACSLALNPQLTTHQVLCEFLRPLVQFHNDRVGAVACYDPPRNIAMSDFHSYVFKARLSSSTITFLSSHAVVASRRRGAAATTTLAPLSTRILQVHIFLSRLFQELWRVQTLSPTPLFHRARC